MDYDETIVRRFGQDCVLLSRSWVVPEKDSWILHLYINTY